MVGRIGKCLVTIVIMVCIIAGFTCTAFAYDIQMPDEMISRYEDTYENVEFRGVLSIPSIGCVVNVYDINEAQRKEDVTAAQGVIDDDDAAVWLHWPFAGGECPLVLDHVNESFYGLHDIELGARAYLVLKDGEFHSYICCGIDEGAINESRNGEARRVYDSNGVCVFQYTDCDIVCGTCDIDGNGSQMVIVKFQEIDLEGSQEGEPSFFARQAGKGLDRLCICMP